MTNLERNQTQLSDVFGTPLQQTRLYEQVADRIRNLIIDEELRPNERLPGERNLAEQLGVSRIVIREAIKFLNAQGLVEIKSGSGTYIKKISSEHIIDTIGLYLKFRRSDNSFRNLLEVRHSLEVDIAALAAERATEEDLMAMETAINQMEAHIADPEQFAKHDLDFHSALATATGNEIYRLLLVPITDLLLDFRIAAYLYDTEEAIQGGLVHHRKVLEQVKAGNAEGARQAMNDHLQQAQNLFEKAHERDDS
jgi:DNA-binding FadR family transcriptional regulator